MGIFARLTGAIGSRRHGKVQAKETDKASRGTPFAEHKETSGPSTMQGSKPLCFGMSENVTAIATTEAASSRKPSVQNIEDGCKMYSYRDGSYIVRDADNLIVRTFDALGVKREFSRDRFTKQLMVKRFGTWTKPERAKLDESGTLSFRNEGVDVSERLNGVHIHFNNETKTSILTDNLKGLEIVTGPDAVEITKRQTTKDGEVFLIWRHKILVFESHTYYTPRRHEAMTTNGKQPLVYVSRWERRWQANDTIEEKFCFRNGINNERNVTLSLQLASGLLMLKGIVSLTTTVKDDKPTQSIFEFKQPTALRVDLPGHRGTLDGISQVRVCDAGANIGLAFKNSSGREYMVLTARRTEVPKLQSAAELISTSPDASVGSTVG